MHIKTNAYLLPHALLVSMHEAFLRDATAIATIQDMPPIHVLAVCVT